MTTTQAAKRLGLKADTVRVYIRDGRIKATWKFSESNHLYLDITKAALKRFERTRRKPGNPTF